MKIAIFTDTFLPQVNGVTNTLKRFGDYLNAKNIEYIFITPDQKCSEKLSYNVEEFFSTPFLFYKECRLTITNKLRLNRRLDRFKPDVIFLMTEFNVGFSGLSYGKKNNIPVISNYSTNFNTIVKSYKLGILERTLNKYIRWFHNKADYTVTPSKESKQVLYSLGVKNVGIFSRGIDYFQYSPQKRSLELRGQFNLEDKILLLYVGRLSAEKDLDVLRDSMHILNKKYKEKITLMLTGEGPMEGELKKQCLKMSFLPVIKKEMNWLKFLQQLIYLPFRLLLKPSAM